MDVIEKVARAIARVVDAGCEDEWDEFVAEARAAIEAHETALRAALIQIDALDPAYPNACREEALRDLVMRMGEIARDALTPAADNLKAPPQAD